MGKNNTDRVTLLSSHHRSIRWRGREWEARERERERGRERRQRPADIEEHLNSHRRGTDISTASKYHPDNNDGLQWQRNIIHTERENIKCRMECLTSAGGIPTYCQLAGTDSVRRKKTAMYAPQLANQSSGQAVRLLLSPRHVYARFTTNVQADARIGGCKPNEGSLLSQKT